MNKLWLRNEIQNKTLINIFYKTHLTLKINLPIVTFIKGYHLTIYICFLRAFSAEKTVRVEQATHVKGIVSENGIMGQLQL